MCKTQTPANVLIRKIGAHDSKFKRGSDYLKKLCGVVTVIRKKKWKPAPGSEMLKASELFIVADESMEMSQVGCVLLFVIIEFSGRRG